MIERPTRTEKLAEAFPTGLITTEEKKEHTECIDQGQVKLGLFIITDHLQKFVENRSLQAVLKKHDLVISWDDGRKKVVVVTSPRQPAKSMNGEVCHRRTTSGSAGCS